MLLCMLKAVDSGLCLLDVLEMLELLELLELLEAMRRALLCPPPSTFNSSVN